MAVKSPLNYTGNKYRILDQILPHFPQNIHDMVDLFCGGATVGLNTPCEHVTFIDSNPYVIGLLKFLASKKIDNIIEDIERLINQYKLSYSAYNGYKFYKNQISDKNYNNGLKQYNSAGFYKLRTDYNSLSDKKTDQANVMLYTLMIYAFNNDLRFSRNGNYNLPVGKTDLNKQNIDKIKQYIQRMQEIDSTFICGDFRDFKIKQALYSADFIYMDPPYLISDAVYNESTKWTYNTENELLKLLTDFTTNKKRFVLSNIIDKSTACNELLTNWIYMHKEFIQVIDINYHYRGASYNKKHRDGNEREIIIKSVY